jgi:hypothetical protein
LVGAFSRVPTKVGTYRSHGRARLHPVLALSLGRIQRVIGAPQQGLGIVAGLPLRQPGTEMHRHAPVLHGQHAVRQRALQALHGGHAVGALGFRQHQHELVAAQPRDAIGGAQQQLADGHQVLQQRIATGMAVRIVGLVEIIQVDHRHAQRRVVARGTRQLALQQFVQAAAVQRLGQWIDARQVTGRAQFLLQLGDALLGTFHFLPRVGQVIARACAACCCTLPVSRITSCSSWLRSAMLRASRSCSA